MQNKMKLTVDLTLEEETLLAERARAQGESVDAFVHRVLREAATGPAKAPNQRSHALPKWPGRVIGDLRREDIYEDAE
jgi:hypothetical protein